MSARAVRSLIAAVAVVAATLGGAAPAAANGVGDLYVASPAGVLEIHVASQAIVETIETTPAPTSLAFAPDGKTLFVGSDGAHVTPIDIATLQLGTPIAFPGTVTALAFPSGSILVGAMPARGTLAYVSVGPGTVRESEAVAGAPNLLAADRRDSRVAVAEAGKGWLEVIDPATSVAHKTTISGEIRAIAIERDRGGLLVATQNPNAVMRLDLASLAMTWTATLTASPTAITDLLDGAVVATGTSLLRVDAQGAKPWATSKGPALSLAASDDGHIVHAGESDRVEAFDSSGKLQRTIELASGKTPASLAPVTRGSSIFNGEGTHGSPSPAKTAQPLGPGSTAGPPTTSMIADGVTRIFSDPPVQGALMVAVAILFCCWLVVRWSARRARPS